jgi:hypothetical protein
MTDPEDATTGSGSGNGDAPPAGTRDADALAHFWRAAHELLAAARTVLDAADALVEEQLESKRDDRAPRVRRIDVTEP